MNSVQSYVSSRFVQFTNVVQLLLGLMLTAVTTPKKCMDHLMTKIGKQEMTEAKRSRVVVKLRKVQTKDGQMEIVPKTMGLPMNGIHHRPQVKNQQFFPYYNEQLELSGIAPDGRKLFMIPTMNEEDKIVRPTMAEKERLKYLQILDQNETVYKRKVVRDMTHLEMSLHNIGIHKRELLDELNAVSTQTQNTITPAQLVKMEVEVVRDQEKVMDPKLVTLLPKDLVRNTIVCRTTPTYSVTNPLLSVQTKEHRTDDPNWPDNTHNDEESYLSYRQRGQLKPNEGPVFYQTHAPITETFINNKIQLRNTIEKEPVRSKGDHLYNQYLGKVRKFGTTRSLERLQQIKQGRMHTRALKRERDAGATSFREWPLMLTVILSIMVLFYLFSGAESILINHERLVNGVHLNNIDRTNVDHSEISINTTLSVMEGLTAMLYVEMIFKVTVTIILCMSMILTILNRNTQTRDISILTASIVLMFFCVGLTFADTMTYPVAYSVNQHEVPLLQDGRLTTIEERRLELPLACTTDNEQIAAAMTSNKLGMYYSVPDIAQVLAKRYWINNTDTARMKCLTTQDLNVRPLKKCRCMVTDAYTEGECITIPITVNGDKRKLYLTNAIICVPAVREDDQCKMFYRDRECYGNFAYGIQKTDKGLLWNDEKDFQYYRMATKVRPTLIYDFVKHTVDTYDDGYGIHVSYQGPYQRWTTKTNNNRPCVTTYKMCNEAGACEERVMGYPQRGTMLTWLHRGKYKVIFDNVCGNTEHLEEVKLISHRALAGYPEVNAIMSVIKSRFEILGRFIVSHGFQFFHMDVIVQKNEKIDRDTMIVNTSYSQLIANMYDIFYDIPTFMPANDDYWTHGNDYVYKKNYTDFDIEIYYELIYKNDSVPYTIDVDAQLLDPIDNASRHDYDRVIKCSIAVDKNNNYQVGLNVYKANYSISDPFEVNFDVFTPEFGHIYKSKVDFRHIDRICWLIKNATMFNDVLTWISSTPCEIQLSGMRYKTGEILIEKQMSSREYNCTVDFMKYATMAKKTSVKFEMCNGKYHCGKTHDVALNICRFTIAGYEFFSYRVLSGVDKWMCAHPNWTVATDGGAVFAVIVLMLILLAMLRGVWIHGSALFYVYRYVKNDVGLYQLRDMHERVTQNIKIGNETSLRGAQMLIAEFKEIYDNPTKKFWGELDRIKEFSEPESVPVEVMFYKRELQAYAIYILNSIFMALPKKLKYVYNKEFTHYDMLTDYMIKYSNYVVTGFQGPTKFEKSIHQLIYLPYQFKTFGKKITKTLSDKSPIKPRIPYAQRQSIMGYCVWTGIKTFAGDLRRFVTTNPGFAIPLIMFLGSQLIFDGISVFGKVQAQTERSNLPIHIPTFEADGSVCVDRCNDINNVYKHTYVNGKMVRKIMCNIPYSRFLTDGYCLWCCDRKLICDIASIACIVGLIFVALLCIKSCLRNVLTRGQSRTSMIAAVLLILLIPSGCKAEQLNSMYHTETIMLPSRPGGEIKIENAETPITVKFITGKHLYTGVAQKYFYTPSIEMHETCGCNYDSVPGVSKTKCGRHHGKCGQDPLSALGAYDCCGDCIVTFYSLQTYTHGAGDSGLRMCKCFWPGTTWYFYSEVISFPHARTKHTTPVELLVKDAGSVFEIEINGEKFTIDNYNKEYKGKNLKFRVAQVVEKLDMPQNVYLYHGHIKKLQKALPAQYINNPLSFYNRIYTPKKCAPGMRPIISESTDFPFAGKNYGPWYSTQPPPRIKLPPSHEEFFGSSEFFINVDDMIDRHIEVVENSTLNVIPETLDKKPCKGPCLRVDDYYKCGDELCTPTMESDAYMIEVDGSKRTTLFITLSIAGSTKQTEAKGEISSFVISKTNCDHTVSTIQLLYNVKCTKAGIIEAKMNGITCLDKLFICNAVGMQTGNFTCSYKVLDSLNYQIGEMNETVDISCFIGFDITKPLKLVDSPTNLTTFNNDKFEFGLSLGLGTAVEKALAAIGSIILIIAIIVSVYFVYLFCGRGRFTDMTKHVKKRLIVGVEKAEKMIDDLKFKQKSSYAAKGTQGTLGPVVSYELILNSGSFANDISTHVAKLDQNDGKWGSKLYPNHNFKMSKQMLNEDADAYAKRVEFEAMLFWVSVLNEELIFDTSKQIYRLAQVSRFNLNKENTHIITGRFAYEFITNAAFKRSIELTFVANLLMKICNHNVNMENVVKEMCQKVNVKIALTIFDAIIEERNRVFQNLMFRFSQAMQKQLKTPVNAMIEARKLRSIMVAISVEQASLRNAQPGIAREPWATVNPANNFATRGGQSGRGRGGIPRGGRNNQIPGGYNIAFETNAIGWNGYQGNFRTDENLPPYSGYNNYDNNRNYPRTCIPATYGNVSNKTDNKPGCNATTPKNQGNETTKQNNQNSENNKAKGQNKNRKKKDKEQSVETGEKIFKRRSNEYTCPLERIGTQTTKHEVPILLENRESGEESIQFVKDDWLKEKFNKQVKSHLVTVEGSKNVIEVEKSTIATACVTSKDLICWVKSCSDNVTTEVTDESGEVELVSKISVSSVTINKVAEKLLNEQTRKDNKISNKKIRESFLGELYYKYFEYDATNTKLYKNIFGRQIKVMYVASINKKALADDVTELRIKIKAKHNNDAIGDVLFKRREKTNFFVYMTRQEEIQFSTNDTVVNMLPGESLIDDTIHSITVQDTYPRVHTFNDILQQIERLESAFEVQDLMEYLNKKAKGIKETNASKIIHSPERVAKYDEIKAKIDQTDYNKLDIIMDYYP